jgi:aminoglycoside 6'-N-acetyltransferase
LRPLAKGDEEELLRIHAAPEVARWWGEPEEGFPWTDEPESTRMVTEVAGAVAGLIQFCEENEPRYRHAGIDLFSIRYFMAVASARRRCVALPSC